MTKEELRAKAIEELKAYIKDDSVILSNSNIDIAIRSIWAIDLTEKIINKEVASITVMLKENEEQCIRQ